MITRNNFNKLLEELGFFCKENIYSKKINKSFLKADFENELLIYPKEINIEGDFTLNFKSNENFVVFECVHRLLSIGYKPEHLTLEPKWKLGHGASGGRADIVIKDNAQNVFAIIECKTAGKEFDDAWAYGLQYPSQLFSYAQQEGSTKCICLYASDFTDIPEYNYYVIPLTDNESLISTFYEGDLTPTYGKSARFDEKFNAWKHTYGQEFLTTGFLEDDMLPFELGKKNFSITDLKIIGHADIQKKYHQFATVLRKYNVSGRENAFDKLVNLFLCKIVDEKQNPAMLKFYWRGMAYDTHFDLQDRLQQLYQQGMRQFLGEEVTYINQEKIDEAFRFLKDDPDATKETINRYFKQLKFFTNNDFAIIDVHNENLFFQNAIILLKMVEMLQDIKLKSEEEDHHNQFLGDMFEGFLDAGVKQSEGQFFTPMPIVKFIINSLPLKQILIKKEQPPKAIDYACGSGHFLTELARQMKPLVKEFKNASPNDYYSNITGIEKEYRLSKVAKVSAFMYGQDEINIIYADALGKSEQISDSTYDILVANPPYSVKGFLETLNMPDKRSFELFGSLDDKSVVTNNSIETFFIERAKQLLTPGGIAAIILPSSILSNDSKIYQQTREILLQHFHLIAVAELGSGTFGKTGTNTVTLFLRRRQTNPAEAEHYRNRARSWVQEGEIKPGHRKNKEYNDLHLLQAYCNHIGIAYVDYAEFLQHETSTETLADTELWQEYEKGFYAITGVKNLQKKPAFKNQTEAAQQKELTEWLHRHIRRQEEEKLYFYLLAQSNAVPVLIIKSPSDNKAMKKFLGYEWSTAKGNEGIKYISSAPQPESEDEPVLVTAQLNSIQTPLYNPAQKDDTTKLNYYIQQSFAGNNFTLPDELKEFAHTINMADMLDFSRKDFNKALSLNVNKTVTQASKWEMKRLGEVSRILIGGTPARNNSTFFSGNNLWVSIAEMKGGIIDVTKEMISEEGVKKSNVKLIPAGTTLLSFKLSIGKTAIAGKDLYTNEAIAGIIPIDKKIISDQYLYQLFNSKLIDLENVGKKAFGKSLNSEYLREEIKIPVPPLKIQQSIISECQTVDEEMKSAQQSLSMAKAQIEKKVKGILDEYQNNKITIGNLTQTTSGSTPLSSNRAYYAGGIIPWINSGEVAQGEITHAENFITDLGLKNSSAKLVPANSLLIAMYGATAGKVGILRFEACTNQAVCALYPNDKYDSKFLRYQLENMYEYLLKIRTGIARDNLSQAKIKNITIILPPIAIQQQLVKEIEILEGQIIDTKNTLNNAQAQKQTILKKWLE